MPNDDNAISPHEPLALVLEDCAGRLPELLPRLSSVIKDREEDFLGLGATVFGINSKAGKFSSTATKMASSVGEGTLQAAISELHAQTGEARTVFASVSSAEQLQGMNEVLDLIGGLDQAMYHFTPMVRTLKILEVTTRIESARLGSAGSGFTTLADDVKALGNIIADHIDKIGMHSSQLTGLVSSALERSRTQIQAQELVVEDMFARLFSGIADLETMRAGTEALVDELATGSRRVSESMGHVIASVQFHDITRQQVEHVEEILQQALDEIRKRPAEEPPYGLGAWVRDVFRLQAPQLSQAEEMFRNAVEEFISSLGSIAANIDGLRNRITAVAYSDNAGGASILDTIHRDIGKVMQAMRTTSEHVAETSRTLSGMADTISTVSSFVHGIEDIGAEIELIALNARVKAVHTGELGRTLAVIAMEIQSLSVDARTRTGKVAEILTHISSLADRLAALAKSSDVAELVGGIQGRFETVLEHLAGLDDELASNIDELSGQGRDLVTQIRDLTSSIRFHKLVSAQLRELEENVTSLQTGFTPFSKELDAARQPEKLKAQLSRYTMDSERLVHLAVLGGHAEESSGGTDLFGDDDVELFGDDNVELFGDDNIELFDAPDSAGGPGSQEDGLGDNVELFGDDNVELFDTPSPADGSGNSDDGFGDNVELFGDEDTNPAAAPQPAETQAELGDNVELFGDNVELFDATEESSRPVPPSGDEAGAGEDRDADEDFGDNVELF